MAALFHYGFEETFGAGPAVDLQVHFLSEAVGDLHGHGGAHRGFEVVAAVEKSFDEADLLDGDDADVDGRQGLVNSGFPVGAKAG